MTPEQIQEITQLRSLNLSPKQIARKLSLRPAEVTAILQDQAQGQGGITRKELPPIEQCFVNKDAVQALLRSSKKGLLGWGKPAPKDDNHGSGFAQIVVTRRDSRDYILCAYLVDYWCLGVKDCLGPRKMDRYKYEQMLPKIYSTMESGYCEITFTEAQSIIWGALDYAKTLGFNPHQDFARAKPHLGDRPDQLIHIEFGREGKPCYFAGPYDNPSRIIETLRKNVGDGNFDFTAPVDML
jgi:hypothetical protein